jgi:glycerol kinase
MDILETMQRDSSYNLKTLRVDGGASQNEFLMQFQSDILDLPIYRSTNIEATARGAAMLAGLGSGILKLDEIKDTDEGTLFKPNMSEEERQRLRKGWQAAIEKALIL